MRFLIQGGSNKHTRFLIKNLTNTNSRGLVRSYYKISRRSEQENAPKGTLINQSIFELHRYCCHFLRFLRSFPLSEKNTFKAANFDPQFLLSVDFLVLFSISPNPGNHQIFYESFCCSKFCDHKEEISKFHIRKISEKS